MKRGYIMISNEELKEVLSYMSKHYCCNGKLKSGLKSYLAFTFKENCYHLRSGKYVCSNQIIWDSIVKYDSYLANIMKNKKYTCLENIIQELS